MLDVLRAKQGYNFCYPNWVLIPVQKTPMNNILYFIDDDYPTNKYHEIILKTIPEIKAFRIFDEPEILSLIHI